MKKYFLLCLLCVNYLISYAQDKVIQLDLPENYISVFVDSFWEDGILLRATAFLEPGEPTIIHYFSADLEETWEAKPKPITQGINRLNGFTVSPGVKYVFQLTSVDPLSRKNPSVLHITRIDHGEITKHKKTIKGLSYWQMALCDDQYLYILTTENGWEYDKKKKGQEKMHLHRFDQNNFSYKDILLDLPSIDDPKNASYWEYLTHYNGEIYLLSKVFNFQTEEYSYHIISVSSEGKILSDVNIKPDINAPYHVQPSFNIKYLPGVHGDFDFLSNGYDVEKRQASVSSKLISLSLSVEMTTTSNYPTCDCNYKPLVGSFGNVMIDKKNNAMYIYGLYGPKPYYKLSHTYSGFFIQKYDLKGKLIWKNTYKVSKELAGNKYFKIHGIPHNRVIDFHIMAKQNLDLEIFIDPQFDPPESHHNYINADGDLINTKKVEHQNLFEGFKFPLENCYEEKFPDLCAYLDGLSTAEKKDLRFKIINSSPGKILLQQSKEDNTVKLLYFKPKE